MFDDQLINHARTRYGSPVGLAFFILNLIKTRCLTKHAKIIKWNLHVVCPPWKINMEPTQLKRKIIFQNIGFRFYINLWECSRYNVAAGKPVSDRTAHPRCQGSLQFPSEISSVKMCGGPKNVRISNGSEEEQHIPNEL